MGTDTAKPRAPIDGPMYWEYLRVDELLSLQDGLSREEDLSRHELLFIVVHQVYELWFKLLLRELTSARDLLRCNPVPDQRLSEACAALRRMRTILDVAGSHFAVVESLSTRDFLDFRDKLLPASGFQSAQLREMEVLLGLRESDRIHLGWEGSYMDMLRGRGGAPSAAHERVVARMADRPSVREALDEWLFRTPVRGSSPDSPGDAEVVAGFTDDFLAAHVAEAARSQANALHQARSDGERERLEKRYASEREAARAFLAAEDVEPGQRARRARIRAAVLFIESYRELPLLAWPRELLEGVVAFEQGFVMFRQRHARMVERVIGRRTGTGGSAGVDYLDETALKYRIFRDVWAVRTLLLRRDAAPELADADYYGFRHGE